MSPGADGTPLPPAAEDVGVDWSLCTWKGSRLDQHRRYLALPFRRKLELLEEMCDFARQTLDSRRQRGLPYVDPHTGEVVRPPAAVPVSPGEEQTPAGAK